MSDFWFGLLLYGLLANRAQQYKFKGPSYIESNHPRLVRMMKINPTTENKMAVVLAELAITSFYTNNRCDGEENALLYDNVLTSAELLGEFIEDSCKLGGQR